MQTQVQFNKLRINVFANKNDFYCFLIRGNLFEKSLSPMSSLAYQINITSTLNIDSPSLARQYDFFYLCSERVNSIIVGLIEWGRRRQRLISFFCVMTVN